MKVLVIPDVHGRTFWKDAVADIESYGRVIFLGDYVDPYGFEGITVEDAIANFEAVVDFASENSEKTVLLLGNHDMPYFSKVYKGFSWFHSRHSNKFHNDIASIFDENREMFKIAHVEDGILFTHAGCTSEWLDETFTDKYPKKGENTLDDLVFSLNNLLATDEGLSRLFRIGYERGGRDKSGSCVWADVSEFEWEREMLKNPEVKVHFIHGVRQVFGHTLQAYYGKDDRIEYGPAVEGDCFKMLDNGNAYELDTETFNIRKL